LTYFYHFLTIFAQKMSFEHTPVLYEELLSNMRIFDNKQNVIVDMTLGLGGHASGIIQMLHPGDIFIGFDADGENLKQAQVNIAEKVKNIPDIQLHFVHSNFQHVLRKLNELGVKSITGAYADLGVSSAHFDDAKRGFSFRFDGPLDMRFDRETKSMTAEDILRDYSAKDLENIFYSYGEEPKTRFIVDAIIKARKIQPLTTTQELVKLIEESSFDPKSKLRVFQALRMEVNNELGVIEDALSDIVKITET